LQRADDCRRAVREAIRRGVDVIKVMASGGTLDEGDGGTGQNSRRGMKAIADTAHAFGASDGHAHAKMAIDACIRPTSTPSSTACGRRRNVAGDEGQGHLARTDSRTITYASADTPRRFAMDR